MKLASLKGGRDGRLVVVSDDLSAAADAKAVCPTLQAALDDWERHAPDLAAIAGELNAGGREGAVPFDPAACAAPLPRAYQWADGSAYLNHMELVRKARGAEMPESFLSDPLMYQGGSDIMLGACDDIVAADEGFGIDFEAEIAVITGDVPMGVSAQEAGAYIRLVMLVNDISLRGLIPGELGKGFGFFQSKPASAFSPVAATPDSLDGAWDGAKLNLPLIAELNGRRVGNPEAGADLNFDFPALISHAARTRFLAAGTIIGSGTVSNRDRSRGSCCLAEVRTIEIIEQGGPVTPFMSFGDRVRIDMVDRSGATLFGAIDQKVARYFREE